MKPHREADSEMWTAWARVKSKPSRMTLSSLKKSAYEYVQLIHAMKADTNS